jgi:putative transposase
LESKIAIRAKELLIQGCSVRNVIIVQGIIDKDHIHMLLSAQSSFALSKLVQYLKGVHQNCYKMNFQNSKTILGSASLGSYFCVTVGSGTKEMIQEYIEKQFEHGNKNHFKIDCSGTVHSALAELRDFQSQL